MVGRGDMHHIDILAVDDGPIVSHDGGLGAGPFFDKLASQIAATLIGIAHGHIIAIGLHAGGRAIPGVDASGLDAPAAPSAHRADPRPPIGAGKAKGAVGATGQHGRAGPG